MSSVPQEFSRPSLRLFAGDLSERSEHDSPRGLSPQMTYGEFYRAWFRPNVLLRKNASDGTLENYDSAIAWWEKLTGDPPISQCDDYTCTAFICGLRTATYKRSLFGKAYPLQPHTQEKHKRAMNAIFFRVGPDVDRKRSSTSLVPKPLYVELDGEQLTPKAAFAFAQVEAQWLAIDRVRIGRPLVRCVENADLLRLAVALLFYSGQRRGVLLRLDRSMLKTADLRSPWTGPQDGEPWFDIPKQITKTKKADQLPLHPTLVRALQAVPVFSSRLFPWTRSLSLLATVLDELQAAANVSPRLCIHAWRRTHLSELAALGHDVGLEVARTAANHSSLRTTLGSYVGASVRAHYLRRLPTLPFADDAPGEPGAS